MKHLKKLGLAAAALLAVTAMVGVASASAAEFHTNLVGAALHGEQTEEHVFTVEGAAVNCSVAEFNGVTTALAAPEQKMTPHYTGCTAFGFAGAEVNTNGCEYNFHANGGTVDVVCPTGAFITIKVETIFNTVCHVDVFAQNGVNNQTYANNAGHTVLTVNTNSNNIKYKVTKSTGLCPLTEGAEGAGGVYTGRTAVEANGGANQVWWE